MPLCVSELISNRELLNAPSINSIVVNSRTNSTNEMENLLNSSSCLINVANSVTGTDNPLTHSTSSSSGSINLPLGPRGSWAPVVCSQTTFIFIHYFICIMIIMTHLSRTRQVPYETWIQKGSTKYINIYQRFVIL